MGDIVVLSIGFGLIISLGFSEILGIAAGGMVVPGYMALFLDKPIVIILTLAVSYFTYFIVHVMGTIMIIYGRRRTVMMILIGFLMGAIIRNVGSLEIQFFTLDLSIVGYIIPGLIAIWIDRQGVMETFASLVIASVIVRLGLILITGGDIQI